MVFPFAPDVFRSEATDTRMVPVQIELKTERFGMAYRLLFAYAFVRPESEQYCSHPRLYCSEPVL
jgi:hypothetical protein